MDFEQPLYIKNSELSFRYSLFEQDYTSYNLDFVDSNGESYPQELAAVDFRGSDIPLLVSSSFNYFPAHTGYRHDTDMFHGQVISERPLVGKPVKLSHVRNLLTTQLNEHLNPTCFAVHESEYIKIWNGRTKQWEGSCYVESHASGMKQLLFEALIPTDNTSDTEVRHDDAKFASEIWVLLHDFAANLSVDLDLPAASLGRVAFNATVGAQTLRIGIDRLSDACRLGMTLLESLDSFYELFPEKPLIIPEDLKISAWDEKLTYMSDEHLREICWRAIRLAQSSNSQLSPAIFKSSVMMHLQLRELGAIQS